MIDETTFLNAYVGVTVSKRPNGIRLCPYIELRGDSSYLKDLQNELLTLSVGCTVMANKGFLRIQGIQNCKIMSAFVKERWFRTVIRMFDDGYHLTDKGREKILAMTPRAERKSFRHNEYVPEAAK